MTFIPADFPVYEVDFNAVHPETWLVLGSADDTQPVRLSPNVGDRVLLVDAEQNRCLAWIANIDGDALEFQLDEETWRSGPEQIQFASTVSRSVLPPNEK